MGQVYVEVTGGSCQRRNHDDGRVWGWDGRYILADLDCQRRVY